MFWFCKRVVEVRVIHRWLVGSTAVALMAGLAGCSPSTAPDPSAQAVELPGAGEDIDFDDVVYAADMGSVLVPAREDGLYLLDPETGRATDVASSGTADSVDPGQGRIFVLDRSGRQIQVLDPEGQVMSSVSTAAGADYVRYAAATKELWVSEPSREGIEIFAVGEDLETAPRQVGFVPVSGGTEGLTLTSDGATAYTHAGNEVVKIDVKARTVAARWASGCEATHGFPRVDEGDGLLLASCAENGKVTLLDVNDGHVIDEYEVGGGESLPAYSPGPDHFYVRSDPGTTIATLAASPQGLELIREVQVPEVGHCLGADEEGHYWTCDAGTGQMLLFEDR